MQVNLFRKFSFCVEGKTTAGIEGQKPQEIFCYLLINRSRPQLREVLAGVLWPDEAPARSRKNLRQVLWQLQSALEATCSGGCPLLLVDDEYIQIHPQADLWLDIHAFEQACTGLRGFNPHAANRAAGSALLSAVELYTGDLLEGWYQDWCLFERERYQNLYLELLDKTVRFCEAAGCYEQGLAYAVQILRYDRANERAHRHIMRLYCYMGDRTRALRQYERCAAALEEELSVAPARQTRELCDLIRSDSLELAKPASSQPGPDAIADTLNRLQSFQHTLRRLQQQVEDDIQQILSALKSS